MLKSFLLIILMPSAANKPVDPISIISTAASYGLDKNDTLSKINE